MSQHRADLNYFSQGELWKPPVEEQVAVAADLISLIPENVQTILDAGCGNGAITNRLVGRWEVLGCDLSETALQHVLAPTLVVDLAAIPLEDNSFDLVIASDVIEHLPASIYDRALSEIARVSSRYVLVAIPYEELLQVAEVSCPACDWRYHAHLHQRSYSISDALTLLGSEFGVRAIQLSGNRWTYRDQPLFNARQAITGLDYAFEDAVCPQCGTRRGMRPQSEYALSVARRFDAMQAMLSVQGLLPTPHRSELIVLFERGLHSEDTAVDLDHDIQLSSFIEVGLLQRVSNPITYPQRPLRINLVTDNMILVLPKSPRHIRVAQGSVGTMEVFDFVRQRYLLGNEVGSNDFELPLVPFGPQGCLVRVVGSSPEFALNVDYEEGRTRDQILDLCFGDDPLALSQGHRLAEVLQQTEELEAKRDWLERQLQARDTALAELQVVAENANNLANSVQAQLESLNRENLSLRQKIKRAILRLLRFR